MRVSIADHLALGWLPMYLSVYRHFYSLLPYINGWDLNVLSTSSTQLLSSCWLLPMYIFKAWISVALSNAKASLLRVMLI